jgi:hypothetical protein
MMTAMIKARQRIERSIARRFILDALAAGYTIRVNDGTDDVAEEHGPFNKVRDVLAAMFTVDQEHLILCRDGKRCGWVQFVYGNDGNDVIADYTTNLEPLMAGANALADKYDQ